MVIADLDAGRGREAALLSARDECRMSAHVGAAHGGRWDAFRVRIRRPPWPALLSVLGLAVAAAVVMAHVADLHTLGATFRDLRPWSLAIAFLSQAMTYVITGTRLAARAPTPLRSLPHGPRLDRGVQDARRPDRARARARGTMWVAHGLHRRGVPRAAAAFAILVGLAGFYLAYGIALMAMLLELIPRPGGAPRLSPPAWTVVWIAMTCGLLWLGLLQPRVTRRLSRVTRLRRLRWSWWRIRAHGERRPRALAEATLLHTLNLALDVATLAAVLDAVHVTVSPGVVLSAFVGAAVVAGLTILPGGVGAFEPSCIALLHARGVPLAAAVAATVLFRILTLVLPMVPALWWARREMRARSSAPEEQLREHDLGQRRHG
jgi:uncharacterized membrane protein YbhN (UPF0104 family)